MSLKRTANAKGRRKGFGGRHIQIPHIILNHIAFTDLSPGAVRLLIEMLRIYNGLNNGSIGLSARSAGCVARVTKDTAQKYLKELQEHGFVMRTVKGTFGNRHGSEWSITWLRDHRSNQPPSHDWKNYIPNFSSKKIMTDSQINKDTLSIPSPKLSYEVGQCGQFVLFSSQSL